MSTRNWTIWLYTKHTYSTKVVWTVAVHKKLGTMIVEEACLHSRTGADGGRPQKKQIHSDLVWNQSISIENKHPKTRLMQPMNWMLHGSTLDSDWWCGFDRNSSSMPWCRSMILKLTVCREHKTYHLVHHAAMNMMTDKALGPLHQRSLHAPEMKFHHLRGSDCSHLSKTSCKHHCVKELEQMQKNIWTICKCLIWIFKYLSIEH